MPNKRPSVKNEKQYEGLKKRGMSKQRAARIANSPGASSRGGKSSGSGTRPPAEGVERPQPASAPSREPAKLKRAGAGPALFLPCELGHTS